MKQANIQLALSKGHEVFLRGVTPAEVLLLVAEHHGNVGGDPIVQLDEVKEELKRTNAEELERLKMKYSTKKLAALYTGAMPNMPETFNEARGLGTKMVLPTAKLMETHIT
jgi:hypothetical protein